MKNIKIIFTWIIRNKVWLLCGVGGIAIFSLFFAIYTSGKGSMTDIDNTLKETNNIEVNGNDNISEDIFQNSIINNISEESNSDQEITMSELVIDIDGDKIYPISSDIKDEQKVGDWIYFRYMLEAYYDDAVTYPVLFRYQEDVCIAERVNIGACYHFEIVGDYVYYLDSTISFQDHGILYVTSADGKDEKELENELYDFQIVDDQYIYYTYRHDTVGVGLEGHALHRMNLDGSEIMIAAYEVSGIDGGGSHFDYRVEDGWVDCGIFKMELGEPADGYEKIVFKDIGDNDWIYYVTNRLMKARKDGSERVELDGVDDYYYTIEKIEDDWIYYIKGGVKYKIRTDGSGKEELTHK